MAKLENSALIQEMLDKKYLNIQRHPTADIWIYNYSSICQIYKGWNEITTQCRGMIVDSDMNILARPFVKFFNYEEIENPDEIPTNLPFEVYEKLDGSLGILYWIGDTPYISTRGSFVSDQAKHATEILHNRYSQYFDQLDRSKTYLFEIIYAENHICVSYGNTDDIFLLAVIDTETGKDENIDNWSHIFKCVKRYDGVTDFTKVRDMFNGDNREGFVIKFANGYRVKMKYEEYFKMSFILNHLSVKVIIEALINGTLDEISNRIEQLNEENKIYFKKILASLYEEYNEIETYIKSLYREFDTDKEAAAYFLNDDNIKYQGVLFNMRYGRDYSSNIWKMILKKHREENKVSE